ncbi:AlwI family type II restriction endonuclease [Schaalia turicensis]|uniref:AlwI family type II restriction endonuclease n=1 Tax=Schaalia turicensis TaxID=131111 RepID=UPI001C5D9518|nr:AlwI family type II restriction endonuclease [Schaalia turicensis]QYB16722.1 AlwI family type II restriction endonuclease [Schaalia turicensis]
MSKAQEESIALALDDSGVISLAETTTDITSIARKWRSVLVKLGFLWPDVGMRPKINGVDQSEIGAPFTLTPNGRRLLAAKSLQGEQEVMLRSLAALRLPSPLEPGYEFAGFSPLKHVVHILEKLEEAHSEPYISRLEMASIVILTNGQDDLDEIVKDIMRQRLLRAASNAKRRFDTQTIRAIAESRGLNYGTLYDYQDVSFRYLKATGLFQSRGRGITLVPEKKKTAELLAATPEPQLNAVEYLDLIASGAALPTDTQDGATEVLSDLLSIASEWTIDFDTSNYDLSTPEGVSLARHDLEQVIFDAKEIRYAADQGNQIDEILAYLQMLDENRSTQEFGEEQLFIPKEERPAYFEWLLWRVLLALDHLVVPPNKVRRFNIDQDFLPVSTASGGGADVIAEYAESVLVVEVTLTENSRQEAAEGEPVRRHVADVLEQFEPLGKVVYGLFIARRIDTNTAETFRIGVWYKRNDERVNLDVVPLTLGQLRKILHVGVKNERLEPALLIDVIVEASLARLETSGAPEWKTRIAEIVGV